MPWPFLASSWSRAPTDELQDALPLLVQLLLRAPSMRIALVEGDDEGLAGVVHQGPRILASCSPMPASRR